MKPDSYLQDGNSGSHGSSSNKAWLILPLVMFAIYLLNFLSGFKNVWGTPFIWPAKKIAPEFVGLWLILLLLVALFGRIGKRTLGLLSIGFFIIVVGRYVEVTVPAWFGRKVNLYWDAQHLPKFLEVASQDYAWWQILGIIGLFFAGLWLLMRVIRLCINILAQHAVPYALRSTSAWVVTVLLTGLVVTGQVANQMTGQMPHQIKIAVSKVVSTSVLAEYHRQGLLLAAAWFPERFGDSLPDSPSLDSDLEVLNGADVNVLFLESYGATTYDRADLAQAIDPLRRQLEQAALAQGRHVLSAFVEAATFGGASDLSHLSFLSGIDLSDPIRHDLLILSDRSLMLETFEQAGYQTIGLYPAMSWEWPEVSFYSFDHYLDGPSLEYPGPEFGLWYLPDQYSLARVDELYPPQAENQPRFLFYPTINSHIPYQPTPPYQPDWRKLLTDKPYSDEETRQATAEPIDWEELFDNYIESMVYAFTWLSSYESLPKPRDAVTILIGDHQPAGGIVRPNASWNVPVHIITDNHVLVERLIAQGFVDGMYPPRQALGHMSDLPLLLLSAFDSNGLNEGGYNASVNTGVNTSLNTSVVEASPVSAAVAQAPDRSNVLQPDQ